MKSVIFAVFTLLMVVLQTSAVVANEAKELRADSDEYYAELNYKKAYKGYYKLAKAGDRYSQSRVAHMYAAGEGKSVDLTEAYAWSVVAAESGKDDYVKHSSDLLLLTENKAAAEKRAAKLVKKYGRDAQRVRTARLTSKENEKRSGQCTGTRLACSRG